MDRCTKLRKLVYYVGTSIDGFIARPNEEIDFFPVTDDIMSWIMECFPETLPTHIRAEVGLETTNQRFDTVIMGRGTYQPALDIGITSPCRHLRQYVVSTTLREVVDPEVELISGDLMAAVAGFKAELRMDIWLAGGGGLAASLLPEIDELIVKRYPIVVGDGIPAFRGQFRPTPFDLVDTRRFESGALVITYRRNTSDSTTL